MVLLNPVVQIFDLAQADGFSNFALQLEHCGLVGIAAIDVDLLRCTMQVNGVLKECARSITITLAAEVEVNRLASFI